ncbi:MAG: hypothetical protein HY063_11100 [Bacteroidetes bacterium]|nr:hypothetical protein [Bacteroidota bacterium]
MKDIRLVLVFLVAWNLGLGAWNFLSAQDNSMYVPHPIKTSPSSAELGIFLGGSYYLGDLNPGGHFNRFTRPAAGGLFRYNFNTRFSAKGIVSLGNIEADDAYSKNEQHRNRNLSFRSRILEFAVEGEFNFLPYTTGKKSSVTSPYVFAGIAVFHFDPQGYYQGKWYNLQPLGTEGQGTTFSDAKPYSLTQFAIPFGVGMKINTAKRIGINFEWGLRKTFTDYLDDVSGTYPDPVLLEEEKGPVAAALSDKSLKKEAGRDTGRQRGDSFTKDWYSFAGIILTFKLRGDEGHCDMPH